MEGEGYTKVSTPLPGHVRTGRWYPEVPTPLARSGWGVLQGTYPAGQEEGVPQGTYPLTKVGTTPWQGTCYTAGGMPLAFTQENFLLYIKMILMQRLDPMELVNSRYSRNSFQMKWPWEHFTQKIRQLQEMLFATKENDLLWNFAALVGIQSFLRQIFLWCLCFKSIRDKYILGKSK